MKARLTFLVICVAFAVICVAVVGWAGCREKGSPLQIWGSKGGFEIKLYNKSFHDAEKGPRIIETCFVWMDGVKTPARPQIEYFNSKNGWTEAAKFAEPTGAKSVKIQMTVLSYGKTYTVTRTLTREQADGPAQDSWKTEPDSIELCHEQGK